MSSTELTQPGLFVRVLRHAELRDLHGVPAAHQHAAGPAGGRAREYLNQLTCEKLIEMFEAYNRWESIFYFLGDVLLKTENKDVHFKNIERAAEVDNLQEARHVRGSTSSRSLWPPSSTRCTRPATSCRPSTCVRPLRHGRRPHALYLYSNNMPA